MISVKLKQSSDINIIKEAGQTAYRSDSPKTIFEYIDMLLRLGHTSVLEHSVYTFEIFCDRGMSHEIVRHRIASYTQESTRYVDFDKKIIDFNLPSDISIQDKIELDALLEHTKAVYTKLKTTYGKDIARGVLPNITGTKIIMTINARSLLNFFQLRYHHTAHKDMQTLSLLMYDELPQEHQYIFRHIFLN